MTGKSDTTSRRVLIGRVAAAHGIRGDVLLHSYADDPADIAAYGPLTDATGTRTFTVKVTRASPKGVVARLSGVADRTAAEALRGTELYADRQRFPATAEDEYYHSDLIGLAAVAPDGTSIGHVVAIENYGAGDLLDIRLAGTTRSELVPFTSAFVTGVELATKTVTVIMPTLSEDAEGIEK
jgi:16S rRNA processing protein RimM